MHAHSRRPGDRCTAGRGSSYIQRPVGVVRRTSSARSASYDVPPVPGRGQPEVPSQRARANHECALGGLRPTRSARSGSGGGSAGEAAEGAAVEDQGVAGVALVDGVQAEEERRRGRRPRPPRRSVQSKRARPSSRVTAPSSETRTGMPSKRWSGSPASWRQTALWWSARTVTPRWPARRRSGQVLEVRAIENDTSGGSRLTLVKELAARPVSSPSTSAATATTPVGKMPKACGSRRGRGPGW